MWLILFSLSAIALGFAPVEFTPEEQEYFERFSNCRSACEVFCEYAEQGVLPCHQQCFLTFCYKRAEPAVPATPEATDTIVLPGPAIEPVSAEPEVDPLPASDTIILPGPAIEPVSAEPEVEPLPEASSALLNLFTESINGFTESGAEDKHAGHGHGVWPASNGLKDEAAAHADHNIHASEPEVDEHAGHGHGYWPASQFKKTDAVHMPVEEPDNQSWLSFFMWVGFVAVLLAGSAFGIVWLVQNKHRIFGRYSRSKKIEDDVLLTESYRRL